MCGYIKMANNFVMKKQSSIHRKNTLPSRTAFQVNIILTWQVINVRMPILTLSFFMARNSSVNCMVFFWALVRIIAVIYLK